ncbi:MAG TPA: MBL fold metallo-hydrolase [Chitinophagaceae bacterium]|nr:MBL fold metallo-hydrolase [Chitinophagaceae bacterium]
MSVFVASLNSGSNGNCYYIGNNEEAILVDAGISGKEVEKRMRSLSLDPEKLKAVFITHEHTDHISGLASLLKKYRLQVYITERTFRACGFSIDGQLLQHFVPFTPIQLGAFTVTAFPKWHDAVDPHSFIVQHAGVTTGVFTDIGEPCKHVINYFRHCHAVFLETNYDDGMLANSRYPVFLRNRISGKQGHLSNLQALELFAAHKPPFMTHVFLSHLSRENNDAAMVTAMFQQRANGTNIIHASRYTPSAVYEVVASTATALPLIPSSMNASIVSVRKTAFAKKPKEASPQLQLSLF